MKPKVTTYSFVALAMIFVAINFGWAHAVAASAFGVNCSPDMKASAKSAVRSLFGTVKSEPIISCFDGETLGLDVSHGSAQFLPFFPSVLVLGPKGQNTDVAAHEYAHAELAYRTSALLRTYRIPAWFDEGLAMQVDHRPAYSRTALKAYLSSRKIPVPKLRNLGTSSGFYRLGTEGRLNYAFSRCVVGAWLNESQKTGLDQLIKNIRWLNAFPVEQFQSYEADCLG